MPRYDEYDPISALTGAERLLVKQGAITARMTVAELVAYASSSGGIAASGVTFTPSGTIAAANVQAAIAELDTETQASLALKANAAAPTFTGAQMTFTYTDAGAASGPNASFVRESSSPAASDLLTHLLFYGRDSGAGLEAYALIGSQIIDPTAASEDGRLFVQTVVAGTLAERFRVDAGVYHPSATGGDKGNNTLNYGTIYENNVRVMTLAGGVFTGNVTISANDPFLTLTDTDAPASSAIIAYYQSQGNLFISSDSGNTRAGSSQYFYIDGVQVMALKGGGGMQVGAAPTGGDKGDGTINAQGTIYQNNVEVAKLSGAAFTGAVSATSSSTAMTATSSAAGNIAVVTSSDAGAAAGPLIYLDRASASPAASDVIGGIYFAGRDSAANSESYAWISATIVDPTSTSEDALIDVATEIAGAAGIRLRVGGGVYHPSATGTDKGNNTINFGAVYDDNVLLTCMAMDAEFAKTGEFTDADMATWDARVPDEVQPERVEERAVTETFEEQKVVRDRDGSYRLKTVMVERPVMEIEPVYAEDGLTGVDMIEAPVYETVVTPEVVTPRVHHAARVFKALLESGFDPRDPQAYVDRMRKDEALPGMPTKADWQHNGLSSGEMMSRLWLATEMLALAVASIEERTR